MHQEQQWAMKMLLLVGMEHMSAGAEWCDVGFSAEYFSLCPLLQDANNFLIA
jgi:hypothetical protein